MKSSIFLRTFSFMVFTRFYECDLTANETIHHHKSELLSNGSKEENEIRNRNTQTTFPPLSNRTKSFSLKHQLGFVASLFRRKTLNEELNNETVKNFTLDDIENYLQLGLGTSEALPLAKKIFKNFVDNISEFASNFFFTLIYSLISPLDLDHCWCSKYTIMIFTSFDLANKNSFEKTFQIHFSETRMEKRKR